MCTEFSRGCSRAAQADPCEGIVLSGLAEGYVVSGKRRITHIRCLGVLAVTGHTFLVEHRGFDQLNIVEGQGSAGDFLNEF